MVLLQLSTRLLFRDDINDLDLVQLALRVNLGAIEGESTCSRLVIDDSAISSLYLFTFNRLQVVLVFESSLQGRLVFRQDLGDS